MPQTIVKSARYPRVAVLLGVNQHYYIPLLVCRSLSTIFAVIWAFQACVQIYNLYDGNTAGDSSIRNRDTPHLLILEHRLRVSQVVLAFLWATTAGYLSHLFASSLMSRWLLHYSPAAVLIRLCSLSIFLSYGCTQLFRFTGALDPKLDKLSRCLPIWVVICICLLISYFTTQQDISIEQDRDDRKRRLVLRLKCLVAMAGSSLFSLLVLLTVIHIGSRQIYEVWQDLVILLKEQAEAYSLMDVVQRITQKDEL